MPSSPSGLSWLPTRSGARFGSHKHIAGHFALGWLRLGPARSPVPHPWALLPPGSTYRGSACSFPRSPGTAEPFPAHQLGRHRPAFVTEKARDSPGAGPGRCCSGSAALRRALSGRGPSTAGDGDDAAAPGREGGTRGAQNSADPPPARCHPSLSPWAWPGGSRPGLCRWEHRQLVPARSTQLGSQRSLRPLAEPAGPWQGGKQHC